MGKVLPFVRRPPRAVEAFPKSAVLVSLALGFLMGLKLASLLQGVATDDALTS